MQVCMYACLLLVVVGGWENFLRTASTKKYSL